MERDVIEQNCKPINDNFNSHAHVERDETKVSYGYEQVISTHTLTWSVTFEASQILNRIMNFNSHAHVERDDVVFCVGKMEKISTHTLTWSVTGGLVFEKRS